jgi:hypothetical protein
MPSSLLSNFTQLQSKSAAGIKPKISFSDQSQIMPQAKGK